MRDPRILVLRGGAIGDFMLTLPAVQALRKRWSGAHIEIVGYPHIAELAFAGGLVNKITSLHKAEIARYFSHRPNISDEQKSYIKSFDIIITYLYDPHITLRTNLLDAGAKQVIYGSPILGKVENTHAIEHLIKPLETLAIYSEGQEHPQLKLKKSYLENGRKRTRDIGNKVVAIHPGSGSPKKNWPVEKFIELAQRLARKTSMSPLFVTGEADTRIESKLKERICEVPVLTGCSLVELAETFSACSAYTGNDSGVTHIAASLGIPVIALYGPTDPDIWGPRGPKVTVIRGAEPTTEGLAAITVDKVFNSLAAVS